ncbi:hypothetical protein HPB51_009157 [Rhipicephalus microplus]|uniref:Cux N-terminal domain-containing protein n=1 Tax=Rhipicephalus microplus TaxID=6941 RepID=A0A9J6F0F1_RHIMP|nr:hypothetical protein HPB51_009157 [Rhipicephalus microplus]
MRTCVYTPRLWSSQRSHVHEVPSIHRRTIGPNQRRRAVVDSVSRASPPLAWPRFSPASLQQPIVAYRQKWSATASSAILRDQWSDRFGATVRKELDVTATELVDRQDASDAARSRLVQLCREFKKTAPHYTEPPCGAHPSLVVWKEEAHDPTKEDPPKVCGAGKAIESSLAFLQPLSTALYTEEICVINLSDVIVFRETQGRGLSGTRAGY